METSDVPSTGTLLPLSSKRSPSRNITAARNRRAGVRFLRRSCLPRGEKRDLTFSRGSLAFSRRNGGGGATGCEENGNAARVPAASAAAFARYGRAVARRRAHDRRRTYARARASSTRTHNGTSVAERYADDAPTGRASGGSCDWPRRPRRR